MLIRALLFVALMCSCVAAQTAKGTLTVNGKSFPLTHAYAFQVPDWTDDSKTKMATLVLVADREVPAKLLKAKVDSFGLRDAGVTGMTMEFYSGGESYALNLVGAGIDGSVSVSGSFDKEKLLTLTGSRVELAPTEASKELGDTTFAYQVEFAADVAPHVVQPAYVPNKADMDEAAKSPVTKAYLAFQTAMANGDLKALEKLVVPERAAMMKEPDFKERFDMIKEFMAKDLKVLRVKVMGNEAELLLTGTMMGEANAKGKAQLTLVNNQWLVGMESWGDTE